MIISIDLANDGLTLDQARTILGDAIHDAADQAQTRLAYFAGLCRAHESARQMSSAEFLARFADGELGDDQDLFDWFAAKQGLDYWSQRFRLLNQVKL